MKVDILISGRVEFVFDKKAYLFKATYTNYKEQIDASASVEDMLIHIAACIIENRVQKSVPGVGIIGITDSVIEGNCGITVNDNFDEVDFVAANRKSDNNN